MHQAQPHALHVAPGARQPERPHPGTGGLGLTPGCLAPARLTASSVSHQERRRGKRAGPWHPRASAQAPWEWALEPNQAGLPVLRVEGQRAAGTASLLAGSGWMVRSCQRAPVNRTDGPPAHLPVPIALLFKVRLREEKKPTDRFGGEARGQEKLEIFI